MQHLSLMYLCLGFWACTEAAKACHMSRKVTSDQESLAKGSNEEAEAVTSLIESMNGHNYCKNLTQMYL